MGGNPKEEKKIRSLMSMSGTRTTERAEGLGEDTLPTAKGCEVPLAATGGPCLTFDCARNEPVQSSHLPDASVSHLSETSMELGLCQAEGGKSDGCVNPDVLGFRGFNELAST